MATAEQTHGGPDVYVAGYEKNAHGRKVATLWKNGETHYLGVAPKDLRVSYCSEAWSVFVSDADVYVAGTEDGVATLWKNGIAQQISCGSFAEASSIFVSGGDVYVVGNSRKYAEYTPTLIGPLSASTVQYIKSSPGDECEVATLWKNGVAQRLTDGASDSYAMSVFVAGENVYVAGVYESHPNAQGNWVLEATLWKNGSPQTLSENCYGVAFSVFVSGKDVYVAGREESAEGTFATLWKNGEAQRLGEGEATSVFVSGEDVYVAGNEDVQGKWVATLWKNGVAQHLNDMNGAGWKISVFVSSGDVYVVGSTSIGKYNGQRVCVCKNGITKTIGTVGNFAEAYSVFVK